MKWFPAALGLGALLPDEFLRPDVARGLAALWAPGPLLFLECVWLGIFVYTGRSQVTGASIAFFVHPEHVHPDAAGKIRAG